MWPERRKRDAPMIRTYGNACERSKRMVVQGASAGLLAVATLVLVLHSGSHAQSATDIKALYMTSGTTAARQRSRADRSVDAAMAKRSTAVLPAHGSDLVKEAPPATEHVPADGSGALEDRPTPVTCALERNDILRGILASLSSDDESDALTPHDVKGHLDGMVRLLQTDARAECWKKQKQVLAPRNRDQDAVAKFFFDLGSRAMDQTLGFVRSFPGAANFHIICFEANPEFNHVYESYQRINRGVHLTYFNEAVGVTNATMMLSNRNVGSSVVRDGRGPLSSRAPDDVEVTVIDFPSKFVSIVKPEAAKRPTHVVIKMDIEKMEFSVLHRLISTGAFVLVDDLLLECHYNTNLPKGRRDPSKHVGLDDCVNLVALLNRAFGGGGEYAFEAVLWNSKKTAKASGYSARHGGFFPT